MHFTTLFAIAMASAPGWASYVLEDDYMSGGNFFDKFSFWDSADPTNGFVSYQAQSDAQSQGLISSSPNNIRMGVNSQDITPNGRQSVRITSTKSYQSGLVILDLDHMPGGICGTWPAFWMVGPDWPSQGEIDIIEGVNDQASNAMTLHTGPDCSISSSTNDSTNSLFSGSIKTNNCDVNAQGQDKNAGCGITTTDTRTYGTGFNQNGGGVYATEWTGSSISVYFFPRGSVPSDIDSGSPDPSTWGTPVAKFEGGCDFSTKFTNQQIVFDTTFCGDWAGATWSGSSCSSKADTCNNFVANNPSAFQDAYWSVNGLKVYSNNGGSGSPSATAETAPPSSVPASHGQPTASAWGAPSAAPPSSAPASQGQSSKSAWGTPAAAPSGPAQSSFVTVSSGGKSSPFPPNLVNTC